MLTVDKGAAFLIARSDGPGTGRFVGRALLDPLTHGSRLVAIAREDGGRLRSADFAFSRDDGSSLEIIRCHVDSSGQLFDCEVWRVLSPAPLTTLDATGLTKLLLIEAEIRALRIHASGLLLETDAGSIALAD